MLDPAPLRAWRYGVIEMAEGTLQAIHLRCWPKVISAWEVQWLGRFHHGQTTGNRCWLYYNQPRRHSNYLVLKYVVSQRGCTLETFRGALTVLDEIARLKQSDALLCDAWNARISDRLLARWGWQAHCQHRWHRHFIKRFYGHYPPSTLPPAQADSSAIAALS